ncbi:MAG: hypothetical protein LBP62_08455 [Clostridiales bacterium]|nr:hypothetical protein [Clostridiales bacterium]
MYKLTIPKTTMQTYISGTQALNVPDETSGDWHFYTVWFSPFEETVTLYGEGQERNTNEIYGTFGIYDKKAVLERYGISSETPEVYVANHYRAILDLAYCCAKRKRMNPVIGGTMDYFDTEEQKTMILELAAKMLDVKYLAEDEQAALKDWIQKESIHIYRGEPYDV